MGFGTGRGEIENRDAIAGDLGGEIVEGVEGSGDGDLAGSGLGRVIEAGFDKVASKGSDEDKKEGEENL